MSLILESPLKSLGTTPLPETSPAALAGRVATLLGRGSPGRQSQAGGCYLQLPQDGVVLDAREQDSHGVGAVVQVGNSRTVQVTGQLIDICLELSKGCEGRARGKSW